MTAAELLPWAEAAQARGERRCPLVYPDRRLVVHRQRSVGEKLATQLLHQGDLQLDPPGLTVPADEFFEVSAQRRRRCEDQPR